MTRPNMLVILSDEHQARAMGCAGHPFVQTPNLDALAARGTRFTNAYTPSPICVPARASFATGRYPHQNRLWDNAMPYHGSSPSWGHALQAVGIPVTSIGKLHYRSAEDPVGFDAMHVPMMVADGVGMVWASVRDEARRKMGTGRMLGDYIGPGTSAYTDYDTTVTQTAVDWIGNHAAQPDPWCLYVGLVAPHFPLVAPPDCFDLYPPGAMPRSKCHPDDGYVRHPWVEKQNAFMDSEAKFKDAQERATAISAYYGLTTWMDQNVGRILAALDASGALDNTVIVYSSDHGDNVGARGLWGKSNMYEESAAIPMMMAGPGVPTGICDTNVSLLDLSATIADHFNAAFFPSNGMRTLYDIIQHPDPDRAVFSEYHAAGAVSGAFMLRRGQWKLIRYVGFDDELFDLKSDPEEGRNLAGLPEFADIQNALRAELADICDIDAANAQAFADQDALIEKFGGIEAAMKLGAPGATPPPRA